MNIDNILDELQQIREQNDQILAILTAEARTNVSKPRRRKDTIITDLPPLDQDIADDIESSINLDWWFKVYGEAPHPAKYMDTQGLGYNAEELHFLTGCLRTLAQRPRYVNGGTHAFEFVGKKYCKAEKNTVACYACIRVA